MFNMDIVKFIYIFSFSNKILMFFIIFSFFKKNDKNLLTKRKIRI